MQVKIKKLHPNAVIPQYAKNGDAGMDLTAVSKHYDEYGNTVYGTGLALEIPEGYFGLLVPRSSNAKTDLRLTNSSGILDSGYRGEVMFKYRNDNYSRMSENMKINLNVGDIAFSNEYGIGERIGQIIILPYPQIEFKEVDELSETERGSGSYGSTGK
jgi:dUTP pyrophosphatase